MKSFLITLVFLISTLAHQVWAEECGASDLAIRVTENKPDPSLERIYDKQSKLWFTQETHVQQPSGLNYDTVVVASNSKGEWVEILAEGHFREYAVETKWIAKGKLFLSVEWGRILFCNYKVDVEKKRASLIQEKKPKNL